MIINYLVSNYGAGQKIHLSAGLFNISSGSLTNFIKLNTSDILLEGEGIDITTLTWNSSHAWYGAGTYGLVCTGDTVGHTTPAYSNITVQDMTLNGNNGGFADSLFLGSEALMVTFRRVKFLTSILNSIGGGPITYTYFIDCQFYNAAEFNFDTDDSISVDHLFLIRPYLDISGAGYPSLGSLGAANCNNIQVIDAIDNTNGITIPSLTLYGCVFRNVTGTTPGSGCIKTPIGVLTKTFGGHVTQAIVNNPTALLGYAIACSGGYAGGNSFTSGQTYTVRGPPVDVSIGAGTSQTITTKDDEGNTIDSAVATLSHRLLMPNYTMLPTSQRELYLSMKQ